MKVFIAMIGWKRKGWSRESINDTYLNVLETDVRL